MQYFHQDSCCFSFKLALISQVDGEEMMAHGHGVLIGPSGTYAGVWSQGMQTVGVYTWYVGAKYEVR